MSNYSSSYMFNNMGRIGNDSTDQSQRSIYNTRFMDYTLSEYFSDKTTDSQVKFATQQPTMMVSGTNIPGSVIDTNSQLLQQEQERPLERLHLETRPFLTIPYLGRGSVDPAIESQLQIGERASDKKSVSTIMETSFDKYIYSPTEPGVNNVEEIALNGWVRGGANTRHESVSK